MVQSKKSVEERLKIKLTKQFNDNDFKTEFRPGYHFNFSMKLEIKTELERIKKDFDNLFFKSKLCNRFILQTKVVNDYIEVQLIRMCKDFMFKIDNPLLINMKKSIENIDGALDILRKMKNGDTVKVSGLFRYEINPDSLSDDDINKRIKELNTERINLSRRIYNMEK